jgi:HK97 family phage prohead protease
MRLASCYEPKIVEGFACRWGEPHICNRRTEVHDRGCFNETLLSKQRIDFCIDHDQSYSLGNTDDNLELMDTPAGLVFRLRVKSQKDFDLLQARRQMSVRHNLSLIDIRDVHGSDVWFIKSARLVEVSACFEGLVPHTSLVVRDSKTVGSLLEDSHCFSNDAAYAALQTALARLL